MGERPFDGEFTSMMMQSLSVRSAMTYQVAWPHSSLSSPRQRVWITQLRRFDMQAQREAAARHPVSLHHCKPGLRFLTRG
jgi:hypothetical protein